MANDEHMKYVRAALEAVGSLQGTKRREDAFYRRFLPMFGPPPAGQPPFDPQRKRRLDNLRYAKTWRDDLTWSKELVLKASSYKPGLLFPDQPVAIWGTETEDLHLPGPTPDIAYANRLLPKATPLQLTRGKRDGVVYFDDDVVLPVLFDPRKKLDVFRGLTPQELMGYRKGLSMAKGTVVVFGYGLGWFLRKICEKDSVGNVIVVTSNKGMAAWYGDRLIRALPKIRETVIEENMYELVGEFGKNAKYLFDVWRGYGEARHDTKFQAVAQKPFDIWGWGDVKV